MTTLKALLLILLAAFVGLPLAAQGTDCSFTFNVTGNATQATVSNLSQNTPCVNWRVTLSTTGTLSSTVTFQTSPDNTTWTAVPNTPCTGAATNCVYQGANPIVGTQGMVSVSAYGSYVRVVTTSSSGTGTGTIRGYGAKGITASYITPGTTGTVTGVTFTGGIISVANPTTAPAFTVAGTSGGIPYFASASTWASSALLTATYAILGGGAGNPPISSTILNGSATGIGIGTVTSTYFLDVSGGVGLTGTARFFDQTATTGSTLVTITPGAAQTASSVVLRVAGAVSSTGNLFLQAANNIFLEPPGSNAVIIDTGIGLSIPTGKLSLGMATAAYELDVSKGVGISGTARFFDQTATTGTTLVTITPGAAQTTASTVLSIGGVAQFAGTNTTAVVAGLIGTTCPAVTCTAAYTWIRAVSSDGSTVFFPTWK